MLRRLLSAMAFLLPVTLPAQVAEQSAVVDLLDRMTADINDLRYAEAIATGRAIVPRAAGLPVALRTRLHLLLAAAYFPEDRAIQRPDSALVHLATAIRATPDAAYPAELRWRGLDSLLARARSSTVAAALRAPARQRVAGPGSEARLGFVATPGTTVELRLRRRADDVIVFADTMVSESGEFRVAAYDGSRVRLSAGAYDLELVARRGADGAVARVHAATVEAPTLELESLPALAPELLLPDSAVPDIRRIRRTGAIAGAATVAFALLARRDPDLRAAYGPDPRSFIAGGAIVAGALWFTRRVEVTPLPANIAANASLRAMHARAVAEVDARNAARLATYAGTLVVATDVP